MLEGYRSLAMQAAKLRGMSRDEARENYYDTYGMGKYAKPMTDYMSKKLYESMLKAIKRGKLTRDMTKESGSWGMRFDKDLQDKWIDMKPGIEYTTEELPWKTALENAYAEAETWRLPANVTARKEASRKRINHFNKNKKIILKRYGVKNLTQLKAKMTLLEYENLRKRMAKEDLTKEGKYELRGNANVLPAVAGLDDLVLPDFD